MTSQAPRSQAEWSRILIDYFSHPTAERAAHSLRESAEIALEIASGTEVFSFTFRRAGGKNALTEGAARNPQIGFTLTPTAAEEVFGTPPEDIGETGVRIMKLLVSSDSSHQVRMSVKTGFLGLMTKGYFGVLAAGGPSVAAYLASRGMGGMGAIKALLKGK